MNNLDPNPIHSLMTDAEWPITYESYVQAAQQWYYAHHHFAPHAPHQGNMEYARWIAARRHCFITPPPWRLRGWQYVPPQRGNAACRDWSTATQHFYISEPHSIIGYGCIQEGQETYVELQRRHDEHQESNGAPRMFHAKVQQKNLGQERNSEVRLIYAPEQWGNTLLQQFYIAVLPNSEDPRSNGLAQVYCATVRPGRVGLGGKADVQLLYIPQQQWNNFGPQSNAAAEQFPAPGKLVNVSHQLNPDAEEFYPPTQQTNAGHKWNVHAEEFTPPKQQATGVDQQPHVRARPRYFPGQETIAEEELSDSEQQETAVDPLSNVPAE